MLLWERQLADLWQPEVVEMPVGVEEVDAEAVVAEEVVAVVEEAVSQSPFTLITCSMEDLKAAGGGCCNLCQNSPCTGSSDCISFTSLDDTGIDLDRPLYRIAFKWNNQAGD